MASSTVLKLSTTTASGSSSANRPEAFTACSHARPSCAAAASSVASSGCTPSASAAAAGAGCIVVGGGAGCSSAASGAGCSAATAAAGAGRVAAVGGAGCSSAASGADRSAAAAGRADATSEASVPRKSQSRKASSFTRGPLGSAAPSSKREPPSRQSSASLARVMASGSKAARTALTMLHGTAPPSPTTPGTHRNVVRIRAFTSSSLACCAPSPRRAAPAERGCAGGMGSATAPPRSPRRPRLRGGACGRCQTGSRPKTPLRP
mmetsp:Transcript_14935/g.47770  ORF Transcript_14935/g.47770 Transcript_14935/m.47770 type:complete len:264 (-) Transcript_14935:2-793(-)